MVKIHGLDYAVQDCGYRTPCWLSIRGKDWNGYGRIERAGKSRKVHRVAYEVAFGSIPEGHHVHHRCEQKTCVNPDHLRALTPAAHNAAHARLSQTQLQNAVRMAGNPTVSQRDIARHFGVPSGIITDAFARIGLKRDQPKKAYCKKGHPLSDGNILFRANGERLCRECHNARQCSYNKRVKEHKESSES